MATFEDAVTSAVAGLSRSGRYVNGVYGDTATIRAKGSIDGNEHTIPFSIRFPKPKGITAGGWELLLYGLDLIGRGCAKAQSGKVKKPEAVSLSPEEKARRKIARKAEMTEKNELKGVASQFNLTAAQIAEILAKHAAK